MSNGVANAAGFKTHRPITPPLDLRRPVLDLAAAKLFKLKRLSLNQKRPWTPKTSKKSKRSSI